MANWLKHLYLGVIIGLLGVMVHVSPAGLWLEEKYGLHWLFHLRGVVTAPEKVMVVAIDQYSATQLDVPLTPRLWPRNLHAQLIDRLTQAGARIVVFDLIFDKPSDTIAHDELLVASMEAAGNIVLVERLVHDDSAFYADSQERNEHRITREGPIQLLPAVASAIKAHAPFPLPKSARVNHYWVFKADAGDIPTIPTVVFQIIALPVYDDFIRLLHNVSPAHADALPGREETTMDIEDLIFSLHDLFSNNPQIATGLQAELNRDARLNSADKQMIQALINLYSGDDTRYLNFYGPPRSIKTIPYYQALHASGNITDATGSAVDFKDMVIFVGFSAANQPEQDVVRDDYHTVFSNPDGLYISGVEIAATAFANLLENRPIRPLSLIGSMGLLFVFGFALGVIFLIRQKQGIAIACVVLVLLYAGGAFYYFKDAGIWLPLVNPLGLQIPAAFFGAVLLRYYEAKLDRQQLKEAFGYFLPERVVNDIVKNAGTMAFSNQLVYGACLATDAEKYTALAEKLEPQQLAQLMNDYYAALFEPVRQHHGIVSDVVGDAMLAIWSKTSSKTDLRKEACHACLDIAAAVDRFNQSSTRQPLPTRIGLHFGEMLLGNIGALHHYEYRAIGDIVNTTNRIQGANKYLGTRILVSSEVITGLDEFLARPLGDFLLTGKSTPVNLLELITHRDSASEQQLWLCETFIRALNAYQHQRWDEACKGFNEILDTMPEDGPARFFFAVCQRYQSTPPTDSWDPTLHISNK